MRVSRDCWKCEYENCGHVWIAVSTEAPEQCARCKKRKWHTEGSVEKVKPSPPAAKDSSASPRKKREVAVPVNAYARPEHDKASCRNQFCLICGAVGKTD